jgi:hypothetical protein
MQRGSKDVSLRRVDVSVMLDGKTARVWLSSGPAYCSLDTSYSLGFISARCWLAAHPGGRLVVG